jgi:hypothetical protein
MEQRSLRLGDIVDDYCPRERRVTNHAVVALVGNSIRQTRCSTCDTEHEYKEAKVPKKRGKGESADGVDLSGGVLVTSKPATNGATSDDGFEDRAPEVATAPASSNQSAVIETEPSPLAAADQNGQNGHQDGGDAAPRDGWLAHRPLIRASLPKTDGDPPPARAIPEFTMHQRHDRHGRGFGGRGGFRHGHQGGGTPSFRGGSGHNHNQSNGNEPDGNRAPQAGRPGPGGPGGPGAPGGGGGRRRRRRRPRP